MGIKEDYDGLVKSWGTLPFIWKTLIVSLTFLQVMSIASIADSIRKFRGFLGVGVEFYQNVTAPLVTWLSYLGLPIPERELFDSLIWANIFYGVLIRSLIISPSFEKQASRAFMAFLGAIFAVLIVSMFTPFVGWFLPIFLSICIWILVFSIECKSLTPIVLLLFPVFLLSLIAGISDGLVNA